MKVQSASFNKTLLEVGGDRMALFERLKHMLIPKEKQKKKEYKIEKQDVLPADGIQMNVSQSDKQVRISHLTRREHDLYLLLLEGFTLKESAKQLGVKYSTANTHMSGIYRKLGVNSRAELIINYGTIKNIK
jgi:DNA-binding CsgD family transcriptional regulator